MDINTYLYREKIEQLRQIYDKSYHFPELTSTQWRTLSLKIIKSLHYKVLKQIEKDISLSIETKLAKDDNSRTELQIFNPFAKLREGHGRDLSFFDLHNYIELSIRQSFKSNYSFVEQLQKYDYGFFLSKYTPNLINLSESNFRSKLEIDLKPPLTEQTNNVLSSLLRFFTQYVNNSGLPIFSRELRSRYDCLFDYLYLRLSKQKVVLIEPVVQDFLEYLTTKTLLISQALVNCYY